jgi:hypothetical protein
LGREGAECTNGLGGKGSRDGLVDMTDLDWEFGRDCT